MELNIQYITGNQFTPSYSTKCFQSLQNFGPFEVFGYKNGVCLTKTYNATMDETYYDL